MSPQGRRGKGNTLSQDKILNQNLTENEQGTIQKMGKLKLLRFTKAMVGAYNKMCTTCKGNAINNPKRSITEYCDSCQEILKPILEKFE